MMKKILKHRLTDVIVATIAMFVGGFIAWQIIMPVIMIVCNTTSRLCFGDQNLNVIVPFVALGALTSCAVTLRYRAKVRWLTSIESIITSGVLVMLLLDVWGGIYHEDTPAYYQIAAVLLWTASMCVTTVFFERFRKWGFVISALVLIGYVASAAPLDRLLEKANDNYKNQKSIQESQRLPFKTYVPSYIPKGYSLIYVSTIATGGRTGQSLTLSYNNKGSEDYYSDITIAEEIINGNLNKPSECRRTGPYTSSDPPCQVLSNTGKGTIYYSSSSDSPDYVNAYLELNGTLIDMAYHTSETPKEDVLKVFESLQQVTPRI